jgi:polyisoprenyl-phosphate glycosyltransferase
MEKIDYSVVVPIYSEEGNLRELYNRLKKIFDKKKWELILVYDCGKDNSLNIIKQLAKEDKNVKYLAFSRNFGHQAALTAGMDNASGKLVVTMDGDLQDPPELIPEMIKKWKEGNDIVYARRKNYRKDNFLKAFLSKRYYNMLARFGSSDIPRNVGDFRLVDRKVLEEVKKMGENSRYLRGMVAWTGFKHAFVDYERIDRQNGESSYTFSKLFQLGLNGLFNFSTFPLKVGFLIGIFSILFGFLSLGYMVWEILATGVRYEFFKFLVVFLVIFNGIMFMFLWILGEYLSRIYNDVRGRPLYIIREKGNI